MKYIIDYYITAMENIMYLGHSLLVTALVVVRCFSYWTNIIDLKACVRLAHDGSQSEQGIICIL